MRFQPLYAAATLLLLAVETAIALFVHDDFVRPHLGDSLAVVLVYLGLRAGTRLEMLPAALVALAIAFGIEIGQYFHLVRLLGLEHIAVARVVLGTGFDRADFLAYMAGAVAALIGDDMIRHEMLAP